MRKKLFRLALFVLLVTICVSTVIAGGSSANTVKAATLRPKGTLPLVDQKTAISVFLGEEGGAMRTSSYTYADNVFTKKITDETNVELNFVIASMANKREQLNILLNAGNYPEVVISTSLGYGEMVYYANQGIFRALDEYEPLSYPRIKAAFDEYPALNQKSRAADGKLYTLPEVNDCLHCIYSGGRMWIYWPWVEKFNGGKMPDSTAEFADFLRFVKKTDLNGNGKSDEIPLTFEGARYIEHFISAFAKPFMPFVLSLNYFGLGLDNKKVVEQYKDPRFREALKYLAGLYSEGLILPDSFSMNQDQMRTLMSADTPVVAATASPWPHHHMIMPSQRLFEYFEIRPMQGPNGQRTASNQDPWSIIRGCYYVTDKAKNPQLAVALYDYLIKFDVMMDSYIGPKGTAWADAAPGTLSVLNLPASHRLLVTYGSQAQNTTWDQASPMIRNKTFRGGEQSTDVPQMVDYITNRKLSLIPSLMTNMAFTNEGWWYLGAKENEKWALPVSAFIPPLAFSDADNTRMADINAVLVDYKKQVMVEFITGRRNINNDSDWNNYLAELDRNGSAEMAGIIQKYIK